MPNAVSGTFTNGKVVFDGVVPPVKTSKVVVVFLDAIHPKKKLTDLFSVLGTWDDPRTTDDIVADIRASRTTRPEFSL
ncbi:MAG: hypothetical protein FWD65_08495 [Coriobacteriia bacterium]|nr:hypothetical protein [Coriobacteriia bacterium]